MYRYLLSKGYTGHVIIIQSIILSNILKQYTPPLHSILISITIKLHLYNPHQIYLTKQDKSKQIPKYTKHNQIQKELDQIALQKLQSIQSKVKDLNYHVKYKYLNLDFMKRHSMGSFSNEKDHNQTDDKDHESEDEDDWVELALQPKNTPSNKSINKSINKPIQPKSVKVKKPIQIKTKKIKKNNKLLNSFSDTFSDYYSNTQRRVYGTYPNDAVPIEDAANKDGVFPLAQRYGYGQNYNPEETDKKSFLSKAKDKAAKNAGSIKLSFGTSFSTKQKKTFSKRKSSILHSVDDSPRTFGSHLNIHRSKRKKRRNEVQQEDDMSFTFGSHLNKYK